MLPSLQSHSQPIPESPRGKLRPRVTKLPLYRKSAFPPFVVINVKMQFAKRECLQDHHVQCTLQQIGSILCQMPLL